MVSKVKKLKPDIVIMDIAMPRLNGIEATKRIKRCAPRTKIIILSAYTSKEYVIEAVRAGAMAYLKKETASKELVDAIAKIVRGEVYLDATFSQYVIEEFRNVNHVTDKSLIDNLTGREREVLKLIAEGKSNKAIADILNLSLKTVETHRQNIMRKLDIHNVVNLVKFAIRAGIATAE